ncbi:hypothetical protein ABDK56_02900 [Sphingomonas sp. ASV193]|uniref:hypothetical protein n=1 Tax=Sphingomonas sp. ASV193 TaxID=3144405 RepID=UPI0032E8F8B6
MRRSYRLFGLRLTSEIPLPDLHEADGDTPADVEVTLAAPRPVERFETVATPGGTTLEIAGVGRFTVTDGRRIAVAPDPGADEGDVRLYLLGSTMGLLLYQRGLMPLHANAVVVDGHAFAFAGASGAGKSTLAAGFVREGLPLLSDDVCAIERDQDGRCHVLPGPRRLRLWRDAVDALGEEADALRRSFPSDPAYEKYDLPVPIERAATGPAPLEAIYVLGDGDRLGFERLSGVAATESLFDHSYRGAYASISGATGAHFQACAAIARSIPIFRLTRPRSHDMLQSQVRQILAQARTQIAPLAS